jgi:carbon-monoxide dehydrogenase large subunit
MTEAVAERYTGHSVKRSEDPRILTGRGNYVDDVRLPGMTHAAFLRSPFPHARIVSVDTSAARAVAGVLGVWSGVELEELVGPGGGMGISSMVGAAFEHSVIATDRARLVGDLVALVVAETRYVAEDACELIEVEYDELTPVASAAHAFDHARPVIFEHFGTNVLNGPDLTLHGDIDGVFARADRVISLTLDQHRHQNVPMECRGSVSSFDPDTGDLTMWSACQGVHTVRTGLAPKLGLALDKVRVRTGDVGGSFGLKIGVSREDVACAVASRQLGRPVKWTEDRFEHLSACGHAREESFDVEAAFSEQGDLLGLKVKMVVDGGAYPGMAARLGPVVEAMIPGPYRLQALEFEHTAVITNKANYVAYRGPWAGETFVRERVLDVIARELGMDPLSIRLRNVVDPGDEPPHMITGRSLVGVTAKQSLERIGELIDIPAFRRRQAAARAEARYLGIGIATYIEAAPGPRGAAPVGREQMSMELAADGTVVIYTAQMPHGQSHETTLAQVAADEMGVPFEQVRVVVGDSNVSPPGFTGGSRAATMAGGAALMTTRALRAKVLDVAAHLLEAAVDDLDISDGSIAVRGVPASAIPLAEVAVAATDTSRFPDASEGGLRVDEVYDGGAGGWSGGTHCAIVEVDAETGLVSFERYVIVEDCGALINPAIVDGQIRGGTAQGIGAVLLERSAYDEAGQYLSSTFMDYLLPTTMDIPRIEIHHLETVPLDPDVNFRGVGEGGMIVAPATLCSAIEDALTPFGVEIREQHLPPARILELIGVVPPEE